MDGSSLYFDLFHFPFPFFFYPLYSPSSFILITSISLHILITLVPEHTLINSFVFSLI
ncbi:hypothetical protein CPB83DRAFT_862510 [Crepidotus variabilis]|uniref:Uncharacterized protein n=1 Tax=Crepidotus variabilis TaxID=179855 RepID=A0A9P6E7C9_9AGAR|nr:hypothetical protein CPB83DRAFT_862510 [Crepidotus variabilis]